MLPQRPLSATGGKRRYPTYATSRGTLRRRASSADAQTQADAAPRRSTIRRDTDFKSSSMENAPRSSPLIGPHLRLRGATKQQLFHLDHRPLGRPAAGFVHTEIGCFRKLEGERCRGASSVESSRSRRSGSPPSRRRIAAPGGAAAGTAFDKRPSASMPAGRRTEPRPEAARGRSAGVQKV
jgi:hypothetical protein